MIKKRYVLNFPPESGDKPLSYHLVRDYDIRINILKAEVYPGKRGSLLLELQGKKENIEKGVQYLTDRWTSAFIFRKKSASTAATVRLCVLPVR